MAEKKSSNPDWGWYVLLGIIFCAVISNVWNNATSSPTPTPSPEPNNPAYDRPSYVFQDGKCVEVKGVDDWDNWGSFTGAPHDRFPNSDCTTYYQGSSRSLDPIQDTPEDALFHFSCRLEQTNETVTVEKKCWYIPRFGLEDCNFNQQKATIPKLLADSNGVFRNADCG